jgi:hypothetical protein
MRVIANFRVYDSITDQEAIPRLRKLAAEMVQRFMDTGKVECSGIVPGIRGGFFVLDVDSAEKLMDLVGDAHELFDVSFDPVISIESLGKFFKSHPPV